MMSSGRSGTAFKSFPITLIAWILGSILCLAWAGYVSAQDSRSFRLASAPLQVDVNSSIGWSFSFEQMTGNVDMISIHQDFFGIPWSQLAAGSALPPSWQAYQQDIRTRAAATGHPVYLSLTPMSSDRVSLSPYVEETSDGFRLVERWSEACFDFVNDPLAAGVRQAYLDYVGMMIQLYEPEYLTSVIEINEYYFSCPAERWDGFVDFANEIYTYVKTNWPDLVVFPSFLMDPYWVLAKQECPDDPVPCLDTSLEPLRALSMDRFGISTYPMVQLATIGDVPRKMITALDALVDSPLVIAETGFNSADIVISGPPLVGSCRTVLPSTHARQALYMDLLFTDANSLNIDLVTWWSFRDYLPLDVGGQCPCPIDQVEICLLLSIIEPFEQALFRSFGNMGVFYNDGSEKPIYALWKRWLDRTIVQTNR